MGISEWRRARADRRALRDEQSSGDSWLEYRRRRRASKRAMRAERRAAGRTGGDIQPDKAWAETMSHGGFFSRGGDES
jgi:hypothetical protein